MQASLENMGRSKQTIDVIQQDVEKKAFKAGGGNFVAPAQRLVDFAAINYHPPCRIVLIAREYHSGILRMLPSFINNSLQQALREFGKKMRGYFTNEAVVVATESRTSSPVRIPGNPVHYSTPA